MTSREIQTRNAYDTLAKEFIRDTRVLAYMFKDCVPAFSSSSIEQIKSEIDACHGMIDHAGGEIPLASGARIIPDLLFAAKQLKGNVDFQKDKPSYKLEARIAAYASALLCHQIDPPIDYDRILPVLSIWITNYYELEESCLRASTNYETIKKETAPEQKDRTMTSSTGVCSRSGTGSMRMTWIRHASCIISSNAGTKRKRRNSWQSTGSIREKTERGGKRCAI